MQSLVIEQLVRASAVRPTVAGVACGALLACLGLALWVTPAAASDAYDDEKRPDRPADDQSGSDQEQDESLSAGGLAVPETLPEQGDKRTDIERELDEADEKDSRRGLEFAWLEGNFGYQVVSLTSLSKGKMAPDLDSTKASGLVYGAGLGVRVLYFTLGARFRTSHFKDYDFWTLGGEAALRVPLGALEPYGMIGLDFAKAGRVRLPEAVGERLRGVHGLGARVGGGLDYYLSDTFSVGAQAAVDFLFLKRPAQDFAICQGVVDCPYADKARSSGLALSTHLVVGLHF